MGIGPTGSAFQSLLNAAFNEAWTAACDWRANFRTPSRQSLWIEELLTRQCVRQIQLSPVTCPL